MACGQTGMHHHSLQGGLCGGGAQRLCAPEGVAPPLWALRVNLEVLSGLLQSNLWLRYTAAVCT